MIPIINDTKFLVDISEWCDSCEFAKKITGTLHGDHAKKLLDKTNQFYKLDFNGLELTVTIGAIYPLVFSALVRNYAKVNFEILLH